MTSYPDFIKGRFAGGDVHVIASGPSLYGFDYSFFKNKTVIAVNHAWKVSNHKFVVFMDRHFAVTESPGVTEQTVCLTRKLPNIKSIQFNDTRIFTYDPEHGVYCRQSSGVSALTVAVQSGASKIFLWGFDSRFFSPEEMRDVAKYNGAEIMPGNKYYGHSTADDFLHTREDVKHKHIYRNMIELFNAFPHEVRSRVVNMSPWSAIEVFKKESLRELVC